MTYMRNPSGNESALADKINEYRQTDDHYLDWQIAAAADELGLEIGPKNADDRDDS